MHYLVAFVRWLRIRWYLTSWANRNKMPFDVRQSILRSAVASYRKQRPTMLPDERKKAAVQMLSVFGTDTPMDAETQNELVAEAFEMLARTESESPFKVGECKCGVPNCPGHQVVDGKVDIPDHPLGHLVMTVPKKG